VTLGKYVREREREREKRRRRERGERRERERGERERERERGQREPREIKGQFLFMGVSKNRTKQLTAIWTHFNKTREP
jgi:hypothetical protein